MQLESFLVCTLAVWRLSHLVTSEDGPWRAFQRFRGLFGAGSFSSLFDCFYCFSLWAAIPFAWITGETWKARLILWPALSGGAILLERFASRRQTPVPPLFVEDQEDQNVLWQQQATNTVDA